MAISPRVSWLSVSGPDGLASSPGIRDRWEDFLRATANPYALYQSPAWFDHALPLESGERYPLGVVHDSGGALAGILPVRRCLFALGFWLRSRTLYTVNFQCVEILGGQPLLRDDEDFYVELIRSLLATFESWDAVYMQWVPRDSYAFKIVSTSRALRRHVAVHLDGEGGEGNTPH